MKEKYIKPNTEIEFFKICNILTESGGGDIQPGDNDTPFGE